MRILYFLLISVLCCPLCIGKLPPVILESNNQASSTTRIALVIGNDNYVDNVHFPLLKVCRNDADSMASVLTACGFTVMTCKDGDRKTITETLGQFVAKLPNYDVALVYYSGHGTEIDGRNYIIPVDLINPGKKNEVVKLMFKNTAIDIQNSIVSEFNKRQDKLNFLIIDACRISLEDNLPGSKAPKTEVELFSKPDQHTGTTVVFATGARQKSFESKGNNSVFTSELIKQIGTSNLSYRDVFMNAAQGTIDLVSKHPSDYLGLQQPQIIDMIYKNFYFRAGPVKTEGTASTNGTAPAAATQPALIDAEELSRFQKADLSYGYVDPDNKVAIPAQFENADPEFHDGLAYAVKNKKFGYINKKGGVVIPFQYDRAFSFANGLGLVYKDGKYGYLDRSGKVAIDFIFDAASPFSEGLAVVKMNGKFGYIDKDEKLVLGYDYEEAGSFFSGRACIKKDGRYGFIDKLGRIVIPCTFDEFASFKNGFAKVKIDDRILTISTTGEVFKEVFTTNRY